MNSMRVYKRKPKVTDEGWICVPGEYSNGLITCKSPIVSLEDIETFLYEVDVSINGSQFTGYPISFRFYKLIIDKVVPDNGSLEGGT